MDRHAVELAKTIFCPQDHRLRGKVESVGVDGDFGALDVLLQQAAHRDCSNGHHGHDEQCRN